MQAQLALVLTDLSNANEEKGYLRCVQGDVVEVTPRPGEAWVTAVTDDGRTGLIPTTHIQSLDDENEEEMEMKTENSGEVASTTPAKRESLYATYRNASTAYTTNSRDSSSSARSSKHSVLTAGPRASVATRTFRAAGINNDRLAALLDVADDALMDEGFFPQASDTFQTFMATKNGSNSSSSSSSSSNSRSARSSISTSPSSSNYSCNGTRSRFNSTASNNSSYGTLPFMRKRTPTILSELSKEAKTNTINNARPPLYSSSSIGDGSIKYLRRRTSSGRNIFDRRRSSSKRLSYSARSQLDELATLYEKDELAEETKSNGSSSSNSGNCSNQNEENAMSAFVSTLESPWPYRIAIQGVSNIAALHPPLKKKHEEDEEDDEEEKYSDDDDDDDSSSSHSPSRGHSHIKGYNSTQTPTIAKSKAMQKANKLMKKLKFVW